MKIKQWLMVIFLFGIITVRYRLGQIYKVWTVNPQFVQDYLPFAEDGLLIVIQNSLECDT